MLIHTSLEGSNITTVLFLGETENNWFVEFPLALALAAELDAPGGKDQASRNPGVDFNRAHGEQEEETDEMTDKLLIDSIDDGQNEEEEFKIRTE
ncbi:hypothetical protein TURU_134231 [Turdus rufiventris]|nr:hypothetical protein TURU_134231 [Turdus rufiventris]